MDPDVIAGLFGRLDRELWIVTAEAGGRRGGLLATFVSQASIVLEMPRVAVGLAHSHFTHDLVEAAGAFGLHLIGGPQADWAWRFGLCSGRDVDKLDGLDVRNGASGAPILLGAAAWLDCRVETRMETGDRTIYLAEVVEGGVEAPGPYLTLHRLLALADEAQRITLREQMEHDRAIDAAAIRAWRADQTRSS